MPKESDYRLPRTVVPSRYVLRLDPDLDAATFAGTAAIDVDVLEAIDEVVLNAIELDIDRAVLANAAGDRLDTTISYDEKTERATLALSTPATPGAWTLETDFRGTLNDQLRGFYRSTYSDEAGESKTIATTQFEATEARRAFPCWDEPDLKATFEVTLVAADGHLAISNSAEISREPAGDGRAAVRFAPTMKMSTYLVAFIVGDLEATESVDVDGVPLRVIYPPGKGHLTDFALEAGAFALRFYADYYGIPYPGDKVDKIAIPDFAWGAMENLGAVTYRETALLVDRKHATQTDLMRVAEVIAHEIAHMWFGDLVTMKWWNGIWLNEAFATFASMKCVEAFRPEWKVWLNFSASRSHSMGTDALASTRPIEFAVASPEEANAMFDSLTYLKGSSVLRMLEQYLGEDTFRAGVSNYLKRHEYANTETHDLWTALDEASGEPVGEIMDTWIFQGGFPQLSVEGRPDDYRISQRQFRYLEPGDHTWKVPVLLTSVDGDERLLLGEDPEPVSVGNGLVVNAGGSGFYRVHYSDGLAASVQERFGDLVPEERYTVISDTWAAVLRGDVPAADFVSLLDVLDGETEVDVWNVALGGLGELDRVASSDVRPDLHRYVRGLVCDRADAMGWAPADGEDDRTRKLRGVLIRALGNLADDRETQQTARTVREQAEADVDAVDAEVADAALSVVAANGDTADFDHFVTKSEAATNPQQVVKYLRAAASVPAPEAVDRLFEMVLDGTVRSQDSFWVLAVMLGHRENGPRVWELMKEHWDELLETMPPTTGRRILDLLPNRSEPAVAADIEAWLADHPIRGGEQYAAQQVELMRVRVGLRAREADRLGKVV